MFNFLYNTSCKHEACNGYTNSHKANSSVSMWLLCCCVAYFSALSVTRYPITIDCKHVGEWLHAWGAMHVVGLDESCNKVDMHGHTKVGGGGWSPQTF